jgi:hypothetical protein
MGLEPLGGTELKKHIKLAKKQKLAFAWSPGKKDGDVLMLDKRKSGKFLSKAARVCSGNQKVSWGEAEVKGKLMTLTCEKELPQMAKLIKRFMRSEKVTLNILILDEDGNELESDIEDLPDDPEMDEDDAAEAAAEDAEAEAADDAEVEDRPEPEPAAAAATSASTDDAAGTDPRDAELRKRLMDMQSPINEADDKYADPLKRMFALAAGHVKGKDYDQCEEIVVKMEKAVAALPPPSPKPDIDPKYLAKRAKATAAEIPNVEEKFQKKLGDVHKTIVKQIKGKEYSKALTGLDKLDAQLKKLGHAPEEVPAPEATTAAATDGATSEDTTTDSGTETGNPAAEWEKMQASLQPRIDALIADKKGDMAAINRVMGFAQDQASAGEFAKAMAAAKKALELVEQGEAMETSAAAAEAAAAAPKGVVDFTKHRMDWRKTRDGLQSQIESLKSAIEKATAGMEGLGDVPTKTPVLFTYLNNIDARLEETLEKLVETPEGDARTKLKSQARSIIDNYRGVLDEPFFKAVDNNGFTSTNIRASALTSLKNVRAALEA